MKTKTCIITILFLAGLVSVRAQNTWTQKADYGGGERVYAAAFSIGGKGYVGFGADSFTAAYKDFWEYDQASDTWTRKADLPGPARRAPVGFSIGNKGYIGTGGTDTALYKDFWEYDPSSDTWTQKANFGGTARVSAVGFSIDGKGYLGTGSDASNIATKDFWEYDPAKDTWTRKSSLGGAGRFRGVGFSVGGHGYIGTGINGSCCPFNLLEDVWEYDPASDMWVKKADFGGGIRGHATGFSIGSKGYTGTGQSDPNSGTITKDLWEFDPVANTWTQKADFGGNERTDATGFSIGGKGYLGTGSDATGLKKDFWEYTPDNLPIVILSTTNLTFGAQLDGTRSRAQSVTLTNSGPVTLNISTIVASADFLQKNNCGSSLPAGDSCTIKVAFNPGAEGVLTGSVTITDNAADSPQTIALTGTGTVVQVSPPALNFGDQAVGTTSDPQAVTITNTGSADLRISGIAISGGNFPDFAQTSTCGRELAAGASCTINVTFTPSAKGDRRAFLLISDGGGDSPQAVRLRGTGISNQ